MAGDPSFTDPPGCRAFVLSTHYDLWSIQGTSLIEVVPDNVDSIIVATVWSNTLGESRSGISSCHLQPQHFIHRASSSPRAIRRSGFFEAPCMLWRDNQERWLSCMWSQPWSTCRRSAFQSSRQLDHCVSIEWEDNGCWQYAHGIPQNWTSVFEGGMLFACGSVGRKLIVRFIILGTRGDGSEE